MDTNAFRFNLSTSVPSMISAKTLGRERKIEYRTPLFEYQSEERYEGWYESYDESLIGAYLW
jgi:hypothetical protein